MANVVAITLVTEARSNSVEVCMTRGASRRCLLKSYSSAYPNARFWSTLPFCAITRTAPGMRFLATAASTSESAIAMPAVMVGEGVACADADGVVRIIPDAIRSVRSNCLARMHISVVIMLDAVESDGASLSEPSSGGTLWRRGHYTCRRDGDTGEPTTNDVVDPVLIKIQARERNGGVQGVDTRSQRIAIQQSNGQSVWIRYDNNTQVVYQNQNYSPTALENGDQVTANIQDAGNGSYYTSYVLVNQSVRGSNGGQPG